MPFKKKKKKDLFLRTVTRKKSTGMWSLWSFPSWRADQTHHKPLLILICFFLTHKKFSAVGTNSNCQCSVSRRVHRQLPWSLFDVVSKCFLYFCSSDNVGAHAKKQTPVRVGTLFSYEHLWHQGFPEAWRNWSQSSHFPCSRTNKLKNSLFEDF